MSEKSVALSLTGGPPWGFRLRGGPAQGLRVSRVRRRSPASSGGLREGDLLLCVNSVAMSGRSYAYVMDLIERHRFLTVEVRRFVSKEGIIPSGPAHDDAWPSDEEVDEEPPLQELQVAELQLASTAPVEAESSNDLQRIDYVEYEEEEDTVTPADPEVSRVPFSKLITEAVPEPTPPRSPVKKYADSAYFNAASEAAFPTVEEQKKMARKVAETLTDMRNRGSRGASMFEKRRERAAKYTLGDDGEEPEPGADFGAVGAGMIDTSVCGSVDDGGAVRVPIPPAPPPPPPPGSQMGGGFRYPTAPPPKTVAEFVEREMHSAPKLTHRDYDPKKAFDIASALHSSSGKAGQMFQKRRQRAIKFTTESEGQAGGVRAAATAASAPGPSLSSKPLKSGGNDASMAAKIQRLQENLGGGGGGGVSDM